MDYIEQINENKGGFDFENVQRNKMISEKLNLGPFSTLKTGTTICGVVCDGAVVLAADTRATEGPIVADKVCDKLHNMAANICCAGAGTSGDLDHTTRMIASQLELLRLQSKREVRVAACVSKLSQHLFKYQGHVGCALVLGGVDITGPKLYTVYPHGSTDSLPFASMGSGSLAAISVLEAGYKDNMTIEEGKHLVAAAIRSGIFNDLGSGSNVDIAVVTRGRTEYFHGFEKHNVRLFRPVKPVHFQKGTTVILDEKKETLKKIIA